MAGQEQALLLVLGAVAGGLLVVFAQLLVDIVLDRMIRRRRAALEGESA